MHRQLNGKNKLDQVPFIHFVLARTSRWKTSYIMMWRIQCSLLNHGNDIKQLLELHVASSFASTMIFFGSYRSCFYPSKNNNISWISSLTLLNTHIFFVFNKELVHNSTCYMWNALVSYIISHINKHQTIHSTKRLLKNTYSKYIRKTTLW